MKLLSPDDLACIQGTEELGAVGTDLGGGGGWGLWKESEIGWFALRKTGGKKKEAEKHPVIVESTHSFLKGSKTQTWIYSQHF